MSADERKKLIEKAGLWLCEEVCLFHYVDAPVSFVIDTYLAVETVELLPGINIQRLVPVIEEAVAKWKGELMFYDGAQIAFGAGSHVLCTDFCNN
jgi:hypothetical protein